MKYMMMMNHPGKQPYAIAQWSPDDISRHMKFMKDFNVKLKAAGEWVLAEGLSGPEQAKLVRADKDGRPVTDGVFPETKEFLAGYWIIDVDSPERAYQLAAQVSAAPGAGGVPLNMAVELRPVMAPPPGQI